MLKPFIKLCLILFSAVFTHSAFADIYEYMDEAGIAHYSDAPNDDGNKHYVPSLKSEIPKSETPKPEVPESQLQVTEAATDNPHATASPDKLPEKNGVRLEQHRYKLNSLACNPYGY